MRRLLLCFVLAGALGDAAMAADRDGEFRTLFDGKTLNGWEGKTDVFRVEDGAIVAGNLKQTIPQNEFLCTKQSFGDFELRFKAKLIGEGKNAGVQFRSRRIPNHHEMIGYQCDIGFAGEQCIWGALYDESRRRKFLAVGEQPPLKEKLRPDGWNDLIVRCEGPRVRIWVNGVSTVDYIEPDADIPREGLIGLQIHSGSPAEAWYKDIRIKTLAPQKPDETKTSFTPPPRLRRPAAVVATEDGVFVANSRTGTVSVVDPQAGTVRTELAVGTQLSDLIALDDGRMLAVDPSEHAVILLEIHRSSKGQAGDSSYDRVVVQRLSVAKYPSVAAFDPQKRQVAVSSLWSRRVTVFTLDNNLTTAHVIDMPFPPRELLWLPVPNRLLVADAFDGELAVIDTDAGRLLSQHELPASNIRGLALSRDRQDVLIAHQVLDAYSSTTADHVFWGGVFQNVLRARAVKDLLRAESQYEDDGEFYRAYPLGSPGDGTGDPGDVLVTPGGQTVVALSGIDALAIRPSDSVPFDRCQSGRRPTALAVAPDGKTLYVVNTSDESLSRVDLTTRKVLATVPLGPPVDRSPVDRGEELFFSAKLSLDSWYSCHSCHGDGHSNGQLNDNFGDGSTGAPKRVLTLLGTANTQPWAWNGSSVTLEQQIEKSVRNTMQGDAIPDSDIAALAAFVRTLPAPPSLDVARGTLDDAAVARGRTVFESHGCANCHRGPTYTTPEIYDVGLDDGRGLREYNPPSLRGVSQREAFFHDNRAESLEDVFRVHRHPGDLKLTDAEIADLVKFLRSL